MFTCDLYAGVVPQLSPPPHDVERLRTTMVDCIVIFNRGRSVVSEINAKLSYITYSILHIRPLNLVLIKKNQQLHSRSQYWNDNEAAPVMADSYIRRMAYFGGITFQSRNGVKNPLTHYLSS